MNYPTPFATRLVTLSLLLLPLVVFAESTVLTGRFDGSERSMMRQTSPFDCRDRSANFLAVAFEVSQAGKYEVFDLFDSHFYWIGRNAGYTLHIYQGGFEPDSSTALQPDTNGRYRLLPGRLYSLMVHAKCAGFEAAWAVAMIGPGSVSSTAVADLPPFSKGNFTAASPTMTSDCGVGYYDWGWGPIHNAPYSQVGPIRLSRSGQYFYGAGFSSQACLAIYTAPVDPDNRRANRLAVLSGFDTTVALEANKDYWFVSHWSGWQLSTAFGEYLHVLVPPASFRINAGLNGAWYDPATPGEGFFISVFDTLNQVFLANFTFSGRTIPGDLYGHRWYTAAGTILADDSAELDLELTSGGAFNATEPRPQQSVIGRLQLRFSDCANGSIVLEGGAPDGLLSEPQAIPLRRLGSDWESICQSQYEGLDEVGPL